MSELEARRLPDGQDQGEEPSAEGGSGDIEIEKKEEITEDQRRHGSREREWTPVETMPPIPESPRSPKV